MSEAFIVRRGAPFEAFAVIAVSYPEGSICTCTNGAKTLKAKDASGRCLFMIPYAGTWTVIITDGEKKAERAVQIDTQYQSVGLSLFYNIVLFEALKGCGFDGTFQQAYTSAEGAKVNIPEDNAYVEAFDPSDYGLGNEAVAISSKTFDLTDYKTLAIKYVKVDYPGSEYLRPRFGVFAEGANLKEEFSAYTMAGKDVDPVEQTLDISALTGKYYVGFATGAGASATANNSSRVSFIELR